jgi:histidyl-tRNA synthetase
MIKAITGTKDILPSDISKWRYLESTVQTIFKNFNYSEIRTPIFEETILFTRSIGEGTDIVGKEMYTFLDKGQTSITLKPEMTASVVRAFIEHSLAHKQPLHKLYYISPIFRQERPQAGRLRQFHQFGAEAIGSASPILDAEMIQISYDILKKLGLKDLKVKINSIGIPEVREKYKKELRGFLNDKKRKLSEDSQKRFDTNILRIFDSKVESDQALLIDAPMLIDQLDEKSKNEFEIVKNILEEVNISFEVDAKLVRGLDYYTKTTFEILSGKVGSQNAVCGGGRYDLLAEQLDGKPTPGVGFAAGIERILLACENENAFNHSEERIDLYIVSVGDNLTEKVYEVASILRRRNFSIEFDYLNRSTKAQMREANKLNARFVLFFGGDEFLSGFFSLKNMKTSEQKQIPINGLENITLD